MIERYEEVMSQWANPCQDSCTNMIEISPDEELRRWAIQQTITVLANADYYYTRYEVDNLLEQITSSALTRQEVQDMINIAVRDKANQSDLDALSQAIDNTNARIDNYTEVNGHMLIINN